MSTLNGLPDPPAAKFAGNAVIKKTDSFFVFPAVDLGTAGSGNLCGKAGLKVRFAFLITERHGWRQKLLAKRAPGAAMARSRDAYGHMALEMINAFMDIGSVFWVE
jgi:hypothetical protein